MNNYVADTMAIVLYLENRKLPNNIKDIFSNASQGNVTIFISAVSLMEIGYLSEKQRIEISIDTVIKFTDENKNFLVKPLDTDIIVEAFKIKDIPELHDRLIAASAYFLNAILITNDPIIRGSKSLKTIW